MNGTICIILGGGQGSRLFPLTKDRSKPAVPIGGKYRLIDIPVSNCLNSNINKIFILTQFNSASLNKHINHTYRFDNFHRGFVDILAAEQSMENTDWYQGTADAVRKNLKHFTSYPGIRHVLILSGDQIYNMNYEDLIKEHEKSQADVTLSLIPVIKEEASEFGLVKLEKKGQRITDFVEKPKDPALLKSLNFSETIKERFPGIEPEKEYLASMGIYLFNVDTLNELLETRYTDFGKELIPSAIKNKKVNGYLFNGYWEDVGTIKAFWRANLDFSALNPKFNFYKSLIYTHSRHLPASRLYNCRIEESLVCEGSILTGTTIKKSIIGIRSIINDNVTIENSIIMGGDFYESDDGLIYDKDNDIIPIGIGKNTYIKNAIIDKNARVGENCKIENVGSIENYDGKNYYIRDGIVIIPKNAVIADNTVI